MKMELIKHPTIGKKQQRIPWTTNIKVELFRLSAQAERHGYSMDWVFNMLYNWHVVRERDNKALLHGRIGFENGVVSIYYAGELWYTLEPK